MQNDIEDVAAIQQALDSLGMALANHNHTWTDEERKSYETACAILKREAGRRYIDHRYTRVAMEAVDCGLWL